MLMLAQGRGRWAVSQKRIIITWGNFASIMFHFKRQQAFLLCNLAYIGSDNRYDVYEYFYSMSMKVPTIVEEAQQALQAGYCVVIGLQSTGEVCFLLLSNFLSYPLQTGYRF